VVPAISGPKAHEAFSGISMRFDDRICRVAGMKTVLITLTRFERLILFFCRRFVRSGLSLILSRISTLQGTCFLPADFFTSRQPLSIPHAHEILHILIIAEGRLASADYTMIALRWPIHLTD
jgi:hypothetical protein